MRCVISPSNKSSPLRGARTPPKKAEARQQESDLATNSQPVVVPVRATVRAEATPPASHGAYEAMARRRFQSPKPFKEGQFWWLRVWDTSQTGSRKRQRLKLAPAEMPVREAQKIAAEKLQPMNRGLVLTGAAMNLGDFVTS